VVSDITTKAGITLVRAGSSLTAMIIERLRNFSQICEVKEPLLIQHSVTAAK